jgi:hypothetical protein
MSLLLLFRPRVGDGPPPEPEPGPEAVTGVGGGYPLAEYNVPGVRLDDDEALTLIALLL